MNEADEMDERILATELASSFERLGRRGDVGDAVRRRALQRMQEAFGDVRSDDSATAQEPSELLELLDEPAPGRSRPWLLVGAAAAVACMVVGLLAVASPSGSTPAPVADSAPSGTPAWVRSATDALGGTVEFSAPSSAAVTRLDPGVVELTLGPSPGASAVTIVHPTSLAPELGRRGFTSLAEVLDAAAGTQRTPSSVGGVAAPRWRWARPTSVGPCQGGVCADLFRSPDDVGVVDDRTTDIWIVDTPVGTEVVVIASLHPDDFSLSPPATVAEIVDSIDLRSLERSPAAGTPTIDTVITRED